ncbi:MAG: PmoA family protein [Planctomycetota bacterium]
MLRSLVTLAGFASSLYCLPSGAEAESGRGTNAVGVTKTEAGAEVTIDGALFAQYQTDSGGRPVLWPIIGPDGSAMTRSYPVGPLQPGEKKDHPHHRGLWFGYDRVQGVNFWHDPGGKKPSPGRGRQVHREFVTVAADIAVARIVTTNDWLDARGKRVATDRRELSFGIEGHDRWIDFTIELRGVNGPLRLGDSKEGAFAVRVPGSMKVDAGRGGQITNSNGLLGAACWGQPASWVDYSGPTSLASATKISGVAIFSHPDNFRPRPRWHVRTYGLFAANPFGEKDFPAIQGYKQGPIEVAKGDALRLRYRVVLHFGNAQQADLPAKFERFARD